MTFRDVAILRITPLAPSMYALYVCISLFTKVSLFTVYNIFWYEINYSYNLDDKFSKTLKNMDLNKECILSPVTMWNIKPPRLTAYTSMCVCVCVCVCVCACQKQVRYKILL